MAYYERNLPHWIPTGRNLFVAWRLYGSLPASVLSTLRKQTDWTHGKRFVHFDRELDALRSGPLWLQEPKIANVVSIAIEEVVKDGLCFIHAHVIMPNHVHLLLEPRAELKQITHAIKGKSARQCNAILNRTGRRFWQEESFDHWVRDSGSFERIRLYIENNPVSAGLVESPEEWPWSSAFRKSTHPPNMS